MLIKTEANKTLKGHKLLIIAPWKAPDEFTAGLAAQFPDLEVIHHVEAWTSGALPQAKVPAETWKDVTILLTFSTLPTPEVAPNLQYVQVMSAGVNHLFKEPIYKDTEVAFCTANGVHG